MIVTDVVQTDVEHSSFDPVKWSFFPGPIHREISL